MHSIAYLHLIHCIFSASRFLIFCNFNFLVKFLIFALIYYFYFPWIIFCLFSWSSLISLSKIILNSLVVHICLFFYQSTTGRLQCSLGGVMFSCFFVCVSDAIYWCLCISWNSHLLQTLWTNFSVEILSPKKRMWCSYWVGFSTSSTSYSAPMLSLCSPVS